MYTLSFPIRFVISQRVALTRGVSQAEATRLGFFGALIAQPLFGILLVSTIAKNTASPTFAKATGPIITKLSPSIGLEGNSVTIVGANLGSQQANITVTFDGTNAAIRNFDPVSGTITTNVPAGVAQADFVDVDVVVAVSNVPSDPVDRKSVV